ncbi:uncharacterized protein LOC143154958 [Ptiloglossa arizonensis]|uniref:uncharacterized protein LOC143154958 n=1 Tax=Ptiloglossa arizonensis TaxID=3350558 RepID=UPI003F9FD519
MNYITKILSFTLKQVKRNQYARFFYIVHHNEKWDLFFVKRDEDSKAVLQYRAKGKVLDMQAINVQYRYARQNLVRQLIETVFTYVIAKYYYMSLVCEYLQKYYFAIQNPDLEDLIVGPN